jgi:hypothetical protein
MELVTESDIYTPSIDEFGNYVDKIPSFVNIKNGIHCPCGSRKGKKYITHSMFSSHLKTKCHQKWIADLNANRTNYYVENESLKTTIQNQRLIIAKMEREIQNKSMTIDYLTSQILLNKNTKLANEMLKFD